MQSQNIPVSWWQQPIPLAENTLFVHEGTQSLPLSPAIAKPHRAYENRIFSSLQLENYATLTEPHVCGWIRNQPMPFNIFHFLLAEIRQLTLRNDDLTFKDLAQAADDAQFSVDDAIDSLLLMLNNIGIQKNNIAKKIEIALSKLSIAQEKLSTSAHAILAHKTVIENAPYVADAVVLSVPYIMQHVIQAQIDTLEYCAAMLYSLDKLTEKIDQFEFSGEKSENPKIIAYIREMLSPALVRSSYNLLSGNQMSIQGRNVSFPYALLKSNASSFLSLNNFLEGIPSELYMLSVLLHLTKEHVLASFVPYLRSFTQPDRAFANAHFNHINPWLTKSANDMREQKSETAQVYAKTIQVRSEYGKLVDQSYHFQELAHLEKKVVCQLACTMSGNTHDEILPFHLHLKDINTLWSEKMYIGINNLYLKKDKKLEKIKGTPSLVSPPLLVNLRIEMEVRKLPQKTILVHRPDMSVDYNRLLFQTLKKMQWCGKSYLFPVGAVYTITYTPLSPILSSQKPISIEEDHSLCTTIKESKRKRKSIVVTDQKKEPSDNKPDFKKQKITFMSEAGDSMKLVLDKINITNNTQKITFSLAITVFQYQIMQKILMLQYPEWVNRIYFTPFQSARFGCSVILELNKNEDALKSITENNFIREVIEDHYPHQKFSEFIEQVSKKIALCQKKTPVSQDDVVKGYLNYIPPNQDLLLKEDVVVLTTPVAENKWHTHPRVKSFSIPIKEILKQASLAKKEIFLGFCFKFTKANVAPSESGALEEEDYKDTVLVQYLFGHKVRKNGVDTIEHAWKGQTDFPFAFKENESSTIGKTGALVFMMRHLMKPYGAIVLDNRRT